jgi:hypothetical protein
LVKYYFDDRMASKRSAWNAWTIEKFIEKAIAIHGNKFDYSKVVYVNSQTKVIIICKTCKTEFPQLPNSHVQGYGCKKCAHTKNHIDQTSNTTEFIKKAVAVHGDKYDYSVSIYTLSRNNIDIKCKKCLKIFKQTPNNHISKGFGCPHCSGNAILTTQEFIEKAIYVHGNMFDYSLTIYIRSSKNVKIRCIKKDVIFEQTPNNHLGGARCPCCNPKHSTPSMLLMKYLSVSYPDIEYALNPREYRIANSRYHADGYISSKNLIVEFQGCYFHGCPMCYKTEGICGKTKTHHIENLNKTFEKRDFILKEGYSFMEIWGCEWSNGLKAVRKLQKIWRSKTDLIRL